MGRARSRPWFNVDCLGLLCMMIAFATIFGEVYLVNWYTLWPLMAVYPVAASIMVLFFNSVVGLLVVTYLRAITSEPGAVERAPSDAPVEELSGVRVWCGEKVTMCRKCRSLKPERAHHCSTCKCCVRLMDHHCIWINNCVGERTQKYFMQFLFYVGVAGVFVFCLQSSRFYICFKYGIETCLIPKSKVFENMFVLILSIILAFLFATFVIIMMADQLSALREDAGYIERLKKEERKNEKVPFWSRLCYVFGEDVTGFTMDWLLPTEPQFTHPPWYLNFPLSRGNSDGEQAA